MIRKLIKSIREYKKETILTPLSVTIEVISGMRVIKSFDLEDEEEKKFKKKSQEIFELFSKAEKILAYNSPTMQFAMYAAMILISWIGARLIVTTNMTELTTGELSSLITEGYVTLVDANIDKNGKITESKDYTGKWAWKHQHHDGRLEYIELKGHIELEHVNFGYEPDKQILHDISVYAKPGQKIAMNLYLHFLMDMIHLSHKMEVNYHKGKDNLFLLQDVQ